MAGEDDDRYAIDLRESPPPPRSSRSSYQRSFEEDGRKAGFAADVRDKRENGDRFRQLRWTTASAPHQEGAKTFWILHISDLQ
ncbi:unnamed protein product [Sphagnum jensenii]|uniref:Uncharacterized protein n=1 Tax=Sphagnum jensenii TaxID=128206 RepID=A0ABP0VVN6_9BRYO